MTSLVLELGAIEGFPILQCEAQNVDTPLLHVCLQELDFSIQTYPSLSSSLSGVFFFGTSSPRVFSVCGARSSNKGYAQKSRVIRAVVEKLQEQRV